MLICSVIELQNNCLLMESASKSGKFVTSVSATSLELFSKRVVGGEGAPNDCKRLERMENVDHLQYYAVYNCYVIIVRFLFIIGLI